MFEWDEDSQRYMAMHHPFTAPLADDPAALQADPGEAVSKGYDLVLNGAEIGGGSIRIHRQDMQQAVFGLLGIGAGGGQREVRLPARGAALWLPAARRHRLRHRPHGGADGRRASIRDVIAFPKTTSAQCLLTDAPSAVADSQLAELGLRLAE